MAKRTITVSDSPLLASSSVTLASSENGIDIYDVTFRFTQTCVPPSVTLTWREDMTNILSCWSPTVTRDRALHQWFAPTVSHSRFCYGAPVLATIGNEDKNTQTIAVSDADYPIALSFCVEDFAQKEQVRYCVEFFSGQCPAMETYRAQIRIDTRSIPFYDSIMSVSQWWACHGYEIRPCSAADEEPLYSTWYNYHQSPKDEELLADLKVAAELGFKTIIVDDGWQIVGTPNGTYDLCGEWKVAPNRFSDFKGFVRSAHQLGIKVALWFSVPFVGFKSPVFQQLEGKFLYLNQVEKAGIVDPRFPEVRQYLIDTYVHFLKTYDLDGFKLDFIDSFRLTETSSTDYERMDCPVLEDAVKLLLTQIRDTLTSIKPDLMFEFRQNYVGPSILSYGTMIRVIDCAYDALSNRLAIADLRMLNYPIAVHSDMLFWGKKEDSLLCAKQLLNVMFAVPQISIKLSECPPEQLQLLHTYVDYWRSHREVLLHGRFRAMHPELNYTQISCEDDRLQIAVLYAGHAYTFTGKDCDIFLAGNEPGLLLDNPTDQSVSAAIFDHMGKQLGQTAVPPNTVVRLPVPIAGLAQIRQNP